MRNAETGEWFPFEEYEAGALREGNGDPEADNYNSLTGYAWSSGKFKLEVRVTSRREVTADLWDDKSVNESKFVDDIGLSFVFAGGDGDDVAQQATTPVRNTWDMWDRFETAHRLKESYFIMKSFFASVQ